MAAEIIIQYNPFLPSHHRKVFTVDKAITLNAWLTENAIQFIYPTFCLFNEEPLLRKDWEINITDNDMIIFIVLPQGHHHGGGKILRSVLSIAVMVAAPMAGSALAGAFGVTGAFATAAITAGVAVSGAVLLNVLVPPPTPSANRVSGFGNTPTPSPTYSLQAQGNQARLGQPIPVIYGRHMIYPDLAATPLRTV